MAGALTPATVLIFTVGRLMSAGRLAAVTGPGEVTNEAVGLVASTVPVAWDSMRMRPLEFASAALQPVDPPVACRFPRFVTFGATNRIAPPLPPPP